MRRGSLGVLIVALGLASPLHAQIDRARDEPHRDLKKYYDETVKNVESNNRDAARQSIADLTKAARAIQDFSKDAPGKLSDGNLRDLASKAKDFVDSNQRLIERLQQLYDKVGKVGESPSSELSSMKSEYDNFLSKFNDVWADLQRAGAALKAACAACVR
jgi:hypothetical protein